MKPQDFVEYRNELLKLRKERLKEIRGCKMKQIFNWIGKRGIARGILAGILFLFAVIIVLQVNTVKANTKLKQKDAQINELLDANITLVQKVVDMKERERRIFNHVKDYILRINKTVPPLVATEIAKNIIIASDKYNLPVTTIVAVMERESHFNPTLCSKAGARGLMQVMPTWVNEKELNVNSRFDFHNIEKGINSGVYVLRKYLGDNNNNMEKALLQYVNYDEQYVIDVYNSMGKFVVFKGISKDNGVVKQEELILQLDEEQEEQKTFEHTIIQGDTLSLIAQKYTGNVLNWKKISKFNPNIVPTQMKIGSKVIIPIEMKTTI